MTDYPVRDGDGNVLISAAQSGVKSPASVTKEMGWGNYSDTQYTESNPFVVTSNVDTNVPNNRGAVDERFKPSDIDTFYDGTVVTGREGDGIILALEMFAVPDVAADSIEVWVDIDGAGPIPDLYKTSFAFFKGAGVPRPIVITLPPYTLDTWQANGGVVKCRTNGTVELYGIRYVIHRLSKGTI